MSLGTCHKCGHPTMKHELDIETGKRICVVLLDPDDPASACGCELDIWHGIEHEEKEQ